MGNLGETFDASGQERIESKFELFPTGPYKCVVVETEMKPTKAGTGTYIELKHQVIDGKYQNRFFWARLNWTNPDATAVAIGKTRFAELCEAVNVLRPSDTNEVKNIPLVMILKKKKRRDGNGEENEVTQYKSLEAYEPQATEQPGNPGGDAPWLKKG